MEATGSGFEYLPQAAAIRPDCLGIVLLVKHQVGVNRHPEPAIRQLQVVFPLHAVQARATKLRASVTATLAFSP